MNERALSAGRQLTLLTRQWLLVSPHRTQRCAMSGIASGKRAISSSRQPMDLVLERVPSFEPAGARRWPGGALLTTARRIVSRCNPVRR